MGSKAPQLPPNMCWCGRCWRSGYIMAYPWWQFWNWGIILVCPVCNGKGVIALGPSLKPQVSPPPPPIREIVTPAIHRDSHAFWILRSGRVVLWPQCKDGRWGARHADNVNVTIADDPADAIFAAEEWGNQRAQKGSVQP